MVVLGGVSLVGVGMYSVPIAAFIGAIAAFALTMTLSEAAGGKPISFVLAGVMIGLGLSSFTNILAVLNPDEHKGILFWMFGSFQSVTLEQMLIILVPTVGIATVMLPPAQLCRMRSMRADEWSGPWPSSPCGNAMTSEERIRHFASAVTIY